MIVMGMGTEVVVVVTTMVDDDDEEEEEEGRRMWCLPVSTHGC
jgi:hypothetical protein